MKASEVLPTGRWPEKSYTSVGGEGGLHLSWHLDRQIDTLFFCFGGTVIPL